MLDERWQMAGSDRRAGMGIGSHADSKAYRRYPDSPPKGYSSLTLTRQWISIPATSAVRILTCLT